MNRRNFLAGAMVAPMVPFTTDEEDESEFIPFEYRYVSIGYDPNGGFYVPHDVSDALERNLFTAKAFKDCL